MSAPPLDLDEAEIRRALRAARRAQSRRHSRDMLAIRALGTGAWAVVFLLLGGVLRHPAWAGGVLSLVAHAAAATGLWLFVRRRPGLADRAWWAIPLLDVPMLALLQLRLLPGVANPGEMVAIHLGPLVLLAGAAALSTDARVVSATCAAAAVAQGSLQLAAGTDPTEIITTALLFLLTALVFRAGSTALGRIADEASYNVLLRQRAERQVESSAHLNTLGTLAAGVGHEINNPITTVMLSMGMLEEVLREERFASDARAEIEELLDGSRVALERVREIVQDLRVVSRGFSGVLAPVDAGRVLDVALRLATHEVRSRAQLERRYGDVPPVLANETRLSQVALNLIVNAAHAIPPGDAQAHCIRLITRPAQEGWVAIEVQDTGAGISPAVRERIFEPFFTTKPEGVGTGLGLYLCARMVEGMGGQIEVDSAPGAGSTFRVLLPAAASARAGVTAAEKKILAVETG